MSPGLPRAVVRRMAVDICDRVLPEVPDVSTLILGVPIFGHLRRVAVMCHDVAYDSSLYPVGDHLGAFGGLDHVVFHGTIGVIKDAVDPTAADGHRPLMIVDVRAE